MTKISDDMLDANTAISLPLGEWSADQSPEQMEVCAALAGYMAALIATNHRWFLHRLKCWLQFEGALQAEECINHHKAIARAVANKTPKHQDAVRSIVANQPDGIREKETFLSLLDG